MLGVLYERFIEANGGLPFLDLQNTASPPGRQIFTPARVLEQLPAYTESSALLYWVFFPLMVFGTYALLRVCL